MSEVIRSQVVRLLRDAIRELEEHPNAITPSELAGLGFLAAAFDRFELGHSLLKRGLEQLSRPSG